MALESEGPQERLSLSSQPCPPKENECVSPQEPGVPAFDLLPPPRGREGFWEAGTAHPPCSSPEVRNTHPLCWSSVSPGAAAPASAPLRVWERLSSTPCGLGLSSASASGGPGLATLGSPASSRDGGSWPAPPSPVRAGRWARPPGCPSRRSGAASRLRPGGAWAEPASHSPTWRHTESPGSQRRKESGHKTRSSPFPQPRDGAGRRSQPLTGSPPAHR